MTPIASRKRALGSPSEGDTANPVGIAKKQRNTTMASRHAQHKRRLLQFNNNRKIHLDEEQPDSEEIVLQQPRKAFPPIIVTHQLKNVKTFHEKVLGWGTKIHFREANNQQQIITYTAEDNNSVQDKLREASIQFITFAVGSEKPKLAVLKGVSKEYDTNDIIQDLQRQSPEVTNATRMTTKRDGKVVDLNFYLVHLKPTASVVKFARTVTECCHHKVTIEHFVKPTSLRGTQCYNCQGFGHGQSGCGQGYRCVACDQPHPKGQCSKPKETPPVCVNCHGPHTASYRGCPVAKKYFEKFAAGNPQSTTSSRTADYQVLNHQQQKKHQQQTRQQQQSTKPIQQQPQRQHKSKQPANKNKTKQQSAWPTLAETKTPAKNNKKKANNNDQNEPTADQVEAPEMMDATTSNDDHQVTNANPLRFLTTEIQNLFGYDIATVMKRVREFLPSYKKLKDCYEKKLLIIELLFSLEHNDD